MGALLTTVTWGFLAVLCLCRFPGGENSSMRGCRGADSMRGPAHLATTYLVPGLTLSSIWSALLHLAV
jgi:hypothetical protein